MTEKNLRKMMSQHDFDMQVLTSGVGTFLFEHGLELSGY